MRLLERVVETKVTEYAQQKGCKALKLNIQGRRGWPDRLYLYKGQVLFIEFKRLGENARKLQEYIHAQLRNDGFTVAVVDIEREGKAAIDYFTSNSDKLRGLR
jgi:Holliday junction resolvase-like predicted endonuclease